MPFRKPTEEELCNVLGGSNWARRLLRRILIVDADDPCKWAACTGDLQEDTDPQIETNGYAVLCDADGNSYLVHNVHDELTGTDTPIITPIDNAPAIADLTGLKPCVNPTYLPVGCAQKNNVQYQVWKLFSGTNHIATLAISDSIPFLCEPYIEDDFEPCVGNITAADSCYFEWNDVVCLTTVTPGFNFNAVSIVVNGLQEGGFAVATLTGVNAGSGQYLISSFSPVLDATLQDNEPLTAITLEYLEKPAGWVPTLANEGKLSPGDLVQTKPECVTGVIRLLNQ